MNKHFVLPKTYLIGYTNINLDNLKEYLSDTDQLEFLEDIEQAQKEGLDNGEILCSFYAKLCYASLTTKKNRNISKVRSIADNITGILDSAHGSVISHCNVNFVTTNCSRIFTHELVRHGIGSSFCLSGDTQIYSGNKLNGGWNGVGKKWKIKDLYNRWINTKTKQYVYLSYIRCFDGEKFVQARIKNVFKSGEKQLFSLELNDGKKIESSKDHLFLTKNGWKSLEKLVIGEEVATNGQECYKSEEWLKKNYLDENKTQAELALMANISEPTIKSWLSKRNIKKPDGVTRFKKGQKPWNTDNGGYNLRPRTEAEKLNLSVQMSGSKNHRWKGDNVTENAGRLRANRLYPTEPCEHCGNPKGHRHHKDRNTKNNIRSNIQFLCNKCHQKLHYLEDGPKTPLTIKWIKIKNIIKTKIDMTYDLEIDHPSHNFVANGFVTHNSQTSGRYVRNDELNVIIDPILEPAYDLVEECRDYLEKWYKRLEDRLDINNEKSFDRKKKLTSAMRRMLPNGQANEIGFSLNLRALRHTIEARTSRHAEWEIRLVFNQVFELIKNKYPIMFSDAKIEFVENANEITFKNKKI